MKKFIIGTLLASSTLMAATVTFQGKPVNLEGESPSVGSKAPTVTVVKNDLSELTVGGASENVQIIAFVPSIDTSVCSLESKTFNSNVKEIKGIQLTIISKDLPFALGRFCEKEKIDNITTASAYKVTSHKEVVQYGVNIKDGFLQDLITRAVFVVDKEGNIVYKEIVSEITEQPNYERVLKIAKQHI